MTMIKSQKGIAIPMALLIIMICSVLVFSLFNYTDRSRNDHIFKREKIRAELLAKGATQLAMLKIRCLPTEFYDASKFANGSGDIMGQTISSENQTEKYLGYWDREGDQFTGNWALNPSDADNNSFISQLGGFMSPNAENGFFEDHQIKILGPFTGRFLVKNIKLLGQEQSNRLDAIELEVYAKEYSEMEAKNVLSNGSNLDFNIDEGITVSEKKLLNWKTLY